MGSEPRRDASRRATARARVDIRQVAEAAGVSPGTVSNTLNHPERVSPATRAAVLQAVARLGFVPNQQARVLTGAPSNIIGLVILDVRSPFFTELAHAVERVAADQNYLLLLSNSENDRDREAQLLRVLAAQRVRGALLTPAPGDDPVVDRLPADVPVVLIDHDGPEDVCSVSVDHVDGGRIAARHLVGLGHTTFGFVGGPVDLHQVVQRREGFTAELRASGVDIEQALTSVHVPGIEIRAGVEAGLRLLRRPLPTAIFCANDLIAFGVYRALARAGVTVPGDVSLVGYDDIDVAADWVVPLTTVRQPTTEMGQRAAALLFEHAAGAPDHRHKQVILAPELVVRASTRAR
ncbi:MAG: LacI family DNA-binding transcriptional regulator [Propioniciclava sp.]